jgi:uncharacterized membrane protein YdbT with pleckstrin-like domain
MRPVMSCTCVSLTRVAAFPDSVLTTDEEVVLHRHPHWKSLIGPMVFLVAAVLVVIATAVLWWGTATLVVAVIALVLALWLTYWPWLRWRSVHYVFTSERVLYREGVLARNGRDIPLGRINDVSFSHNLLDRMLGCGTLTIESAGERGQLALVDLPGVERAQTVLYELVEADRARYAALAAQEQDEPQPQVPKRARDLREGNIP